MKKSIIYLLGISMLFVQCKTQTDTTPNNVPELDTDQALSYCVEQTRRGLDSLVANEGGKIDYHWIPRNILKGETHWNCREAIKEEWCNGFYPGALWYAYEYSNDDSIKENAIRFTEELEFLSKTPAYDHDLGFLIFPSYGNGYRLTHNESYKQVIINTADTLATLFNPKVGTILSWPREVEPRNWPHNTIIDNMINLEMLFWAARNGGSHKLYEIAVSHADRTMECQFQPNYRVAHVAVYDTINGDFIKRVTHQGYSDTSLWARGQSWAIYGYTVCYRETRDPKYLDFAQKVTDAYLKDLPSDYVPYWDFCDPAIPNAPKDASAACVVASALLEMQSYLEGEKKEAYLNAAMKMLSSLSSQDYQSRSQNVAYLLHSTGHWPAKSEIDASIVYADYYYIEALTRLRRLQRGEPIINY